MNKETYKDAHGHDDYYYEPKDCDTMNDTDKIAIERIKQLKDGESIAYWTTNADGKLVMETLTKRITGGNNNQEKE